VAKLSDMKPKPLLFGSLAVVALALLLLLPAQLPAARPLDAAGPEATNTSPPPPEPGDTATPTVTPAARAFAPIVFELGRAPTPFLTHTPPAPPPGPTPVGQAFAPAVFEQGRSPTPFVTAPPPTVGPTNTPPAPPSP
jgi:hypothetical protein